MASTPSISARPVQSPAPNTDRAATPDNRPATPVFSRKTGTAAELPGQAATARTNPADQAHEHVEWCEKISSLFDAQVPRGSAATRVFDFGSPGDRGRIMEVGPAQIYIDFENRGTGLMLTGGVITPSGTTKARDIFSMLETAASALHGTAPGTPAAT